MIVLPEPTAVPCVLLTVLWKPTATVSELSACGTLTDGRGSCHLSVCALAKCGSVPIDGLSALADGSGICSGCLRPLTHRSRVRVVRESA